MLKLATLSALGAALALTVAACGGGGERPAPAQEAPGLGPTKDAGQPGSQGPAGPAGPAGAPRATVAPAPPSAAPFSGADRQLAQVAGTASVPQLETAGRKVIATASITIEVQDVGAAISRVRSAAEGLGGFVEQLSSSGGDPDKARATITIRVPEPEFFTALERLERLGKVTGRNVGSQDVSEQFIDLEARLKSARRQEESFLGLLARAQNVTEILTIERELARVRGEIERLQGQLNFLQRRVALATISVTLAAPTVEPTNPPSGSLAMGVSNVQGALAEVKGLVANLKGVVESSSISVSGGKEQAFITFRVFAADFDGAIAAIERKGEVVAKEVREGGPTPAGARPAEKPDARVQASLAERQKEKEGFPTWALVLSIVLPVVLLSVGAVGAGALRRSRRAP